MFGAIQKALMRLAMKVLENVVSQLFKQQNIVQEMALAPMRAMVQQVTNGVWEGQGANAFVDEVNSLFIPNTNRVVENITKYTGNLQFARDRIQRADEEVDRLVKGRIFDQFKFY